MNKTTAVEYNLESARFAARAVKQMFKARKCRQRTTQRKYIGTNMSVKYVEASESPKLSHQVVRSDSSGTLGAGKL